MGKNVNHKGKISHSKNKDRSKHWKYGKSSGKLKTEKDANE